MSSATHILSLTTRFHEILINISQIVEKARNNKRTRRLLRSALKDLTPLVKDINQFNQHLNQPRVEINSLIQENVVQQTTCKCSSDNTFWNKCLSWFGNGSYVVDDSESLTVKDVKETLYQVREILELINNENFEHKLNEDEGPPIKSPFGVPENPEFTAGLDKPFTKLKMELLKDGSSTLVLTGLGGLGKTTLATKLCWDEHVKAKFKENIIFVTFSKTPMLKIIIERLFEHCGYYPVPEFQTDEDAVNRLGILLKKVEGSPLLLVLDDVWPNSETLIQKLQFQISDFKILVTSRVAFQRFSTTCVLKPLVHGDAVILFHHYAQMEKNNSNILDKDLVEKVVKNCKGLPLAIKVTATSLRNRPYDFWRKIVKELSQGHAILDSNTELLSLLQKILDVLEDNPILKECFKDLALFPEDHRIPVVALIYMWTELYELDDNGIEAMEIINKLGSMNLAHVLIARKNASDADEYNYNSQFITLHDLVRDLGIYQSTKEPIEKRKRMIIDINVNKWEPSEKQQGLMIRSLTKFFSLCVKQNPQQLDARILSVSADDTCSSDWSQFQTAQAEVLILNLHTKQYLFPESMEKMSKLKVLIITNYSFHASELNNFELLDSLHSLTRIRLERISVPSFRTLKNLKKISLYMCNTSLAFEKDSIVISDAFPNLEELNIDYCKDLVVLPNAVCDITPLKKLSVTNCHKLSALPQDIGKLENLELLRLSSCTDLEVIPNSIGKLSNLRHLDISNCITLSSLPEEFGNLCNLRNLYMSSCASCELPFSVMNLLNLKVVTCDEETAASWEAFQHMLPNMKIEVPHVDVNLNWLH